MNKDARQIVIGFGNKAIIYQYDEKEQHLLPIKDILNGLKWVVSRRGQVN